MFQSRKRIKRKAARHDGRYVPITEDCRVAIELAKLLPDPSEYLFHKKDGTSHGCAFGQKEKRLHLSKRLISDLGKL